LTDGIEIERVWLLSGMPDIPSDTLGKAERWEIEQGYLPDPDGHVHAKGFPEGRVRRIRRSDGSVVCKHTVKRGIGIVREELERSIDDRQFADWWPMTQGRRITKTRLRMEVNGLLWELDEFRTLALVMLEVELPAKDAPIAMPEWLARRVVREVSLDPRYRNAGLAINGVPASD